jgi:hypothetical protein
MENSTVQLETRWTLHLGSVGGDHYLNYSFYYSMSHHRPISGRICPGKHIAQSTIMLTAASVLSTFDLVKKVDENGREIEPKREYTTSAAAR